MIIEHDKRYKKNISRIYFETTIGNDEKTPVTEGLWGEKVDNFQDNTAFKLLNTPFYAREISYEDVVYASPRIDGGFNYAGIADRGGHSTYRLLIPSVNKLFQQQWYRIEQLGCTFESTTVLNGILYAVDIPPTTDIFKSYEIMTKGIELGIWWVQEAHVGHNLRDNLI